MFWKKKEPIRTNDERIENLEYIDRFYTTVGVYGEPLSPNELSRRIKRAIEDMNDLIIELERK